MHPHILSHIHPTGVRVRTRASEGAQKSERGRKRESEPATAGMCKKGGSSSTLQGTLRHLKLSGSCDVGLHQVSRTGVQLVCSNCLGRAVRLLVPPLQQHGGARPEKHAVPRRDREQADGGKGQQALVSYSRCAAAVRRHRARHPGKGVRVGYAPMANYSLLFTKFAILRPFGCCTSCNGFN